MRTTAGQLLRKAPIYSLYPAFFRPLRDLRWPTISVHACPHRLPHRLRLCFRRLRPARRQHGCTGESLAF